MTPRIIDQLFSEIILEQSKDALPSLNLAADGPLFEIFHPRMIKGMLEYISDPNRLPDPCSLPDWNFCSFFDLSEAQNPFPKLKAKRCLPYMVGKFLKEASEEALFDLGPLGAFVVSKNKIEVTERKGVHQHVIPPFISYALGPELWGPQGKWPRFHERLHTQFEKYNLLNGNDFPGFYPLKPEAKKLENHGIKGSTFNSQFLLVLPWTFSLTALEKLEKILAQEF